MAEGTAARGNETANVERVLKNHRKHKKLSKRLKYRMKKLQKQTKESQKKKTLQKQ